VQYFPKNFQGISKAVFPLIHLYDCRQMYLYICLRKNTYYLHVVSTVLYCKLKSNLTIFHVLGELDWVDDGGQQKGNHCKNTFVSVVNITFVNVYNYTFRTPEIYIVSERQKRLKRAEIFIGTRCLCA
jgi:hypothetical protein